MHVNICGYGFVGGSMGYLCKANNVKFSIYDTISKYEPQATEIFTDISELISWSESNNECNYYVICVPTPSGSNGECNTSIVESVISELSIKCTKETFIIIKSTVVPGTCKKLYEKYHKKNLDIVLVPEFLTERRANLDMYESDFVLFGTFDGNINTKVVELLNAMYKHKPDIKCITKKYEECEIFKYSINCFLGVKVWFFNEIFEICEKLGIQYESVRDMLQLDKRIGMSHTLVPGPDGKFAYGGACIPKEISGCLNLQTQLGIPNNVLKEIRCRNTQLRKKSIN